MPNPSWAPLTAYAAKDIVIDANNNVQQCQSAGRSASTLPTFGTAIGSVTNDGSVVWTCAAELAGATLPDDLVGLPPPQFLNDADGLDPNAILADMVETFQTLADRPLYPAQLEQLLINLYAYREAVVRNLIQYCGQQSLLAFANFPNIDYLGQLLGVSRLLPAGALTVLKFSFIDGQPRGVAYARAAGTVVRTKDGAVAFATKHDLLINVGDLSAEVGAVCTTPGVAGNGYAVGQVTELATPDSIVEVENITITSDGAPIESTEKYRARIQQAPNRFAVAGPADAYRFFAMSVDPAISDVRVSSPLPGQVLVVVLGSVTVQPSSDAGQGAVSQPLIDAVTAALSGDTVRPLCDTVTVQAAVAHPYGVRGVVTIQPKTDVSAIEAAITLAVRQFALKVAASLQRDIVPEEWIAVIGSLGGVYRVQIAEPDFVVLEPNEWAQCTNVTLIIQGTDGTLFDTLKI
jgi:phage-related baseplate assembly protein